MDNLAKKQPSARVHSPTTGSSPAHDSAANSPVMHKFTESNTLLPKKLFVFFGVLMLLGVGTGYLLSTFTEKTGKAIVPGVTNVGSSVEKGKVYGLNDTQTFKDTAEGEVKEGGIEGEGQYHLVRPGGESQNVYMTSSAVDLSQFIGRKIKVWGQTQQAQHAGWLMDVGRVEVLE